jgi:hypothetical protein
MSLAMLARKNQAAGSSRASASSITAASGLKIGQPDSAFEHKADRVADEIMAGGAPRMHWSLSNLSIAAPLQRKCDCGGSGKCGSCNEGETLQRKPAGPSQVRPRDEWSMTVTSSASAGLSRQSRL